MPTRGLSRFLVPLLAVSLAGCGLFDDDDRAPWRAQAEATCFARGMVKLTSLIAATKEVDGKGACGLDRPLKVTALADGSVRIGDKAVTMSCPMTAALETWVRDVVQPAAWRHYGAPVVELKSMGTYNCRSRNNRKGARLSEHAFANAIDISGFVLSNGYTVTVLKGWKGSESDRAFLRHAHAGACGPFSTVLGPGSDGMHENHLHLDLARHNAQGTYRYCRPKIDLPPAGSTPMIMVRQDATTAVAGLPPAMPPAWPIVLPQSIDAANAPPPAPISAPVRPAPMSIDDLLPPPPAVPNCPPGYICTPAALQEPPPIGWQVGPAAVGGYGADPLGYTDD